MLQTAKFLSFYFISERVWASIGYKYDKSIYNVGNISATVRCSNMIHLLTL